MAQAEIASAYVSLIPTFKGGRAAIEDEFKGPAEEGGKEAGNTFGESFGAAFKGLLAAGAILGGAQMLGAAFSLALEQADLPGLMQSQFGLTEEAAAASAETASAVFANGWGASLGEVGTAVGEVSRQLEQLGQTGDVESLTTNAQALADTWGQDVLGVINAASQMVKTELAPDMASALDVLAAGFQNGLDAGGDLLDTVIEYGVQFQNLGLDGGTALGIINQGLVAGARNGDLVADALKEFSIRATDGSAAEAFKDIGLSADEMTAAITEGGPAAAEALDTTLDTLRAIEDPAARDAAAFQIFGTQAEDLGDSLYAIDPSEAAAGLGDVAGAAQEVSDTVGGGLQAQMDTLARSFNDELAGALEFLMPLLQALIDIVGPLLPLLIPLAVAIGILVVVQWAWNAALAASPITWIILAIVALIAIVILLVVHWDTVSAALVTAWTWLKELAITVWTAVADFFVQIGQSIADFFVGIWTGIVNFFSGIWDKMVAIALGIALGTIAALEWLGDLPGKVGAWFEGVYNSAVDKLGSLVDWVKGVPGMIMDALGDLGGLLVQAGKDLLNGFIEGIEDAWGWVEGKLGDLTSALPDWKGPESVDKEILRQSGRWAIGGFITGMDDEIPAVEASLADLTDDLGGFGMAPPRSVAGGATASLSDEDRALLRELAAARNLVDVRLGADLWAQQTRRNAMEVA
jgi:phage-related minor tail protein